MRKDALKDWKLLIDLAKKKNDLSYANFITKKPLSYYIKRIKNLGFTSKTNILDVGCGYGQWSVAMSTFNKNITGLEKSNLRLSIAKKYIESLGISNTNFVYGDALDIPFPDNSFDAVFCYGVFMFLDKDKALNEFKRVLKNKGKLYVCTNSGGWWLSLFIKNIFVNRKIAIIALKAFFHSQNKQIPTSINRNEAKKLLKRNNNWNNIQIDFEGCIQNIENLKSSYPKKFLFFDNVIEFTCNYSK